MPPLTVTQLLETPDQNRSRRWGAIVLLLVVALGGWGLVSQCTADGGSSQVEVGLDQLYQACRTGRARAYRAAQRSFRQATSMAVVEPYPAFLVRAAERMAQLRDASAPAADLTAEDRFFTALAGRRWAAARNAVDALATQSAPPRQLRYMRRLLGELRDRDAMRP